MDSQNEAAKLTAMAGLTLLGSAIAFEEGVITNYALDYHGRCILLGDLIFCKDMRDRLISEGRAVVDDFKMRLAGPTDTASIPDELRAERSVEIENV